MRVQTCRTKNCSRDDVCRHDNNVKLSTKSFFFQISRKTQISRNKLFYADFRTFQLCCTNRCSQAETYSWKMERNWSFDLIPDILHMLSVHITISPCTPWLRYHNGILRHWSWWSKVALHGVHCYKTKNAIRIKNNDERLGNLSAIVYHEPMESQADSLHLPRCVQGSIKHYRHTNVIKRIKLFIRNQVANLSFKSSQILLARISWWHPGEHPLPRLATRLHRKRFTQLICACKHSGCYLQDWLWDWLNLIL